MFNIFKTTKRIRPTLVDQAFFDETIINQKKPAIITFAAAWCGACKMQKPLINELAHHHREKDIVIGLIDSDEQRSLSQLFNVTSIPTTIFFKDGNAIGKKVGLMTRRELENVVAEITKLSE